MAKSDFSYDSHADDLFLYRKRKKTKGSVEMGNIILDFDKDGVNAIQFIDASKTLSEIMGIRITKKLLSCITATTLDSDAKSGNLIVRFGILTMGEKISAPIIVPGFKEKSPVLAYV